MPVPGRAPEGRPSAEKRNRPRRFRVSEGKSVSRSGRTSGVSGGVKEYGKSDKTENKGQTGKEECTHGRHSHSIHVQQHAHHGNGRGRECDCCFQCRETGIQGISKEYAFRGAARRQGCVETGHGAWHEVGRGTRQGTRCGARSGPEGPSDGRLFRDNDPGRDAHPAQRVSAAETKAGVGKEKLFWPDIPVLHVDCVDART